MTVFTHQVTTPGDVELVMERMWQPGADEFDRIGMDKSPHAAAAKFINMADYGFTFFADGQPIAVCGAQHADGTYYTWFMATPDIDKVGREFTMWLRKFTLDIVSQEGKNLEMYSASLHPNSDRWFYALGFERGDKDSGIYRHYCYTRKNKLTVNA